MKSFFSTVLAVIVAFISLWVLGFGLLILVSVFTSGDEAPKVKENTLLHLKLNAPIEERGSTDPFAGLDFVSLEPTTALGMNDLMLGLEAAAKDDRVAGVLLDMGSFSAGYGHLEELGDYLGAFKESGKKIYTYGEFYTQKGAYLAALADSAILHPGGLMDLRGVGVSITYYKDFFDKYGIEPVIVRGTGNDYKSAVEPYISNEMSEANRDQLTVLSYILNSSFSKVWFYFILIFKKRFFKYIWFCSSFILCKIFICNSILNNLFSWLSFFNKIRFITI